LASSEDAESAGSAHTNPEHLHGLEFEYDCDAPKCGLSIHALLDPNHPEAENSIPAACGLSKTLLFEQTVDGGFDRILKLEEGAVLELGKLERKPIPPPSEQGAPSGTAGATAVTASTTTVNSAAPATTVDAPTAPQPTAEETTRRKRRFTPFHFRKRVQGRAVMGPALTVVDAEPAPVPAAAAAVATSSESSKLPEKPTEGDGVKIIIRLAALDEHGVDLGSVNEQMTYLHIVRFGAKPESENPGDDARPWVVQVVKREATVRAYAFSVPPVSLLDASPRRSGFTLSTCTRYTASRRHPRRRPRRPHRPHTATRPPSAPRPCPAPRPSASCASPARGRSCSSRAGTSSRARSAR
jgi:hypothetical protein